MAMAKTRKLDAIMFTDVVGFSCQMGANEARMLRLLEVHDQLMQQAVTEYHGHVIKTIGDAFLVEFPWLTGCWAMFICEKSSMRRPLPRPNGPSPSIPTTLMGMKRWARFSALLGGRRRLRGWWSRRYASILVSRSPSYGSWAVRIS